MSDNRIQQFSQVQNEGLELFKKKNADYGDAFANYGSVGVIVRMGDKIQRLVSVSNRQISLVDTESLRDTLIDLHNYAAMAIMLLDENQHSVPASENQKREPGLTREEWIQLKMGFR
jgi:hypothetical protein